MSKLISKGYVLRRKGTNTYLADADDMTPAQKKRHPLKHRTLDADYLYGTSQFFVPAGSNLVMFLNSLGTARLVKDHDPNLEIVPVRVVHQEGQE